MTGYDSSKTRLDVARALSDIASLYLDLWAEAEAKHADREMPGGDAMNMLGPVANLEAWEHRYEAAEARAISMDDPWTTANGGANYGSDQLAAEDHPLLILATWEDAIREECEQPTDLRATVPRAIDYLRGKLDRITAEDIHEDPQWPAVEPLLTDLKKVRATLEALLHEGYRADRGADCLTCGQRLVREWAQGPGKTDDDDHWNCTPCGFRYNHAAYMLAVRADYMARATWLQADHMQEQYRIPVGTLQGWAGKGHVAKRRNIHTGRMVYRVLDAVKRRDRDEVAA